MKLTAGGILWSFSLLRYFKPLYFDIFRPFALCFDVVCDMVFMRRSPRRFVFLFLSNIQLEKERPPEVIHPAVFLVMRYAFLFDMLKTRKNYRYI